ncbi:hypothetical protein [Nonomuraea sp. NPDC005692]|uniref:hypothetical protein n=1 Tax=Nonomuraea sp. NPDC005692 TaxID=3157168 RepID=UPI0033FF97CE
MRAAIWSGVGLALAATVTHYVIDAARDDPPGIGVTLLVVSALVAGGWLAGHPATRKVGSVFLVSGALGTVRPVLELWKELGMPIVEIGDGVGFDYWLTYWLWVPQVWLILLIAVALYPDGVVRRRSVVWVSALATGVTSTVMAGDNWPRSDGGAGGNPMSLPWEAAVWMQPAAIILSAAAVLLVLASLGARWRTADRATRRLLLIPPLVYVGALGQLVLMNVMPMEAADLVWIPIALICASAAGLTTTRRIRLPAGSAAPAR